MNTQNFYKKFVELSFKTGIPVKSMVDMFIVLGDKGEIDNIDVSTLTGLSKVAIGQIEKEFYSLFKPKSNKTALTENGMRIYMYLKDTLTKSKIGEINLTLSSDNSLHSRYENQRPAVERNYDQILATSETVSKRVYIMDLLCDIRDKRVLFLGDDDFTSIEVANLGTAEKITVLDIDDRILNTIKKISDTEKLKIETKKYDSRESIGKDLWSQYDVVFTDPPYTTAGFELFLSRALDVLDKNNKSARVYICFGHSDLSKERFIPILSAIANAGLTVRYSFNKFNRYRGAESIGSNSDLYICEVTSKTDPTIKGKYKENIYTNEY